MIYKGNTKIKEVYYGNKPISKIYKGTELLFTKKPSFTGTILTLNRWVPDVDEPLPAGTVISQVSRSGVKTKTYSWSTTLEPGEYTFRFNDRDGDSDVVTCEVSSNYTLAVTWGGDTYSKLYVSTTGLKVEYIQEYRATHMAYPSWDYWYFANKYITTVEII
jgi:hypothetical protein